MIRTGRRAAILALAVLATLMTLALAPTASATFPGRNGLIAFQAQTDNGIQIFTMRPNGHDLRQITHVDGDATLADWSPDGRRIAFALNECSIALMDADGGNLGVIASDPDLCQGDPAFTADGSRLVYDRYDPVADVEQTWSMKLDGSDQRFLTALGGPDPNVSPDGRKLSVKGANGALFVQNMDGSGVVQVSPTMEVAFKHDWAPDSQHLVFSDNAGPGPNDAVNIATVRPDGTDLRFVTHYPAPFRAFVGGYSPDGQWIIFGWRITACSPCSGCGRMVPRCIASHISRPSFPGPSTGGPPFIADPLQRGRSPAPPLQKCACGGPGSVLRFGSSAPRFWSG